MKERPILFSAEMVRAILDGRKTQTRRVISDPPTGRENFAPNYWGQNASWFFRDAYYADVDHEIGKYVKCPYGVIGDRLWVRETWAHDDPNCKDVKCGNRDHIWWKASELKIVADSFAGDAHWRSSRFMPRWASRITLEIVNVRIERVQEISESDAIAEGIKRINQADHFAWQDYTGNDQSLSPLMSFQSLWESINEERGHGWDVNPWVWVIEFRKV